MDDLLDCYSGSCRAELPPTCFLCRTGCFLQQQGFATSPHCCLHPMMPHLLCGCRRRWYYGDLSMVKAEWMAICVTSASEGLPDKGSLPFSMSLWSVYFSGYLRKWARKSFVVSCIDVAAKRDLPVVQWCAFQNIRLPTLARSSLRRFKISNFGTNLSVCQPYCV